MGEAIVCSGLAKVYGRVSALAGLDLAVPEGTVFGFLGPNGAGKTTTIRLLTGLGKPSAGKAWVAGISVADGSRQLRAGIGYLPEEPAFYPWMTAREFLLYVANLFRQPADVAAQRAEEALAMVGLADVARRRTGGFSRGMRQRLGIAQALINRPRVLFLDEPCSALDPIGRREVLEVIEHLRGQVTVFMSTHILSDVERVCDVVGVVDKGRLVAQAPIAEMRERYGSRSIEVEFAAPVDGFAGQLATLPGILRVEEFAGSAGPGWRLHAGDAPRAGLDVLQMVAAQGLQLARYEIVAPRLEEVFVRLVGKAGD